MREMVRQGHKTLMISSDANHLTTARQLEGSYLVETVGGVDVCWVRTYKFKGAKSIGRILSWLDFEWRVWRLPKQQFTRPDAVIVSSLSLLTIFNGLWLRRRYGCRLIFEVRPSCRSSRLRGSRKCLVTWCSTIRPTVGMSASRTAGCRRGAAPGCPNA